MLKSIKIAAAASAFVLIGATPAMAGDGSGATPNLSVTYSAAPV